MGQKYLHKYIFSIVFGVLIMYAKQMDETLDEAIVENYFERSSFLLTLMATSPKMCETNLFSCSYENWATIVPKEKLRPWKYLRILCVLYNKYFYFPLANFQSSQMTDSFRLGLLVRTVTPMS